MTKNILITLLLIVCCVLGTKLYRIHRDELPALELGRSVEAGGAAAPGLVLETCPLPGPRQASHKAVHGGCLNVIGSCATGHAEVVVNEGVLEMFFVGGGDSAAKAVRVPEKGIVLHSWAEDGTARQIVLEPRPLKLAGERPCDCSHFVGSAPWLAGQESFEAYGWVQFKGQARPLVIRYPQGNLPSCVPPAIN